jgi:transposase-like protein
MKGATMKATLERLGVIASYSRPRVSDDNPFSEAPPSVREVVRRLEMISHFQRAGRRDEVAYSTERRAAVLKKLEPPHAVPLRQLAKEEGISEATLHTWRRDARSQGRLLPDADAGPDAWTSRDKFAAVLETAALNEVDLAAYCRQRGLYAEQIQTWRTACEQANDWARASSQRLGQATKDDKKHILVLERDLARKEKALAEAAALLVLRKNAAAIWGDGEDA